MNYQTIEKNAERISKVNHSINKYNWKWIDFAPEPKDLVKFGKNNKAIAPNVFYTPQNTKTIIVTYRSEYNNKHEKQVISLMISNGMSILDIRY